jgi:hypothetical protein
VTPGADWSDQARRLVETLRGALGGLADHDVDGGSATGGSATGGSATGGSATGGSATGDAAECRWCPLCQLIAVLRGERPELAAVLADVLRATADALHAFAAAPDGSRPADAPADAPADEIPVGDPPPVVQRIEIA